MKNPHVKVVEGVRIVRPGRFWSVFCLVLVAFPRFAALGYVREVEVQNLYSAPVWVGVSGTNSFTFPPGRTVVSVDLEDSVSIGVSTNSFAFTLPSASKVRLTLASDTNGFLVVADSLGGFSRVQWVLWGFGVGLICFGFAWVFGFVRGGLSGGPPEV